MVNDIEDIVTDETEINEDDTVAVAQMMMEMGQVVDDWILTLFTRTNSLVVVMSIGTCISFII